MYSLSEGFQAMDQQVGVWEQEPQIRIQSVPLGFGV
jgi:hypothetical protein